MFRDIYGALQIYKEISMSALGKEKGYKFV
jgi:hypothetical protein